MITDDQLDFDAIAEAAAILGITTPFGVEVTPNLYEEVQRHGTTPPASQTGRKRDLFGVTIYNLKPIQIRLEARLDVVKANHTLWHELGHIRQLDAIFKGDRRRMENTYNTFNRLIGYDKNPMELLAEFDSIANSSTMLLHS